MKKIATITFHSPYNYGSSFQAYALQETVKNICDQNCEYKIINLRTERQKHMYSIDREKSPLSKITRNIIMRDYKKSYEIKNQKFEDFINNKLNVTKEYNSIEELEKENFDFDYYISGSDQLWNPYHTEPFLLLLNLRTLKYSYASSIGVPDIPVQFYSLYEKALADFSSISVRETAAIKPLKKLTDRPIIKVVDPTFLLTRSEWMNFAKDSSLNECQLNQPYILCYFIADNESATTDNPAIPQAIVLSISLSCKAISIASYEYLSCI